MTTLWDTTGTAVVRALAAERRTGGARHQRQRAHPGRRRRRAGRRRGRGGRDDRGEQAPDAAAHGRPPPDRRARAAAGRRGPARRSARARARPSSCGCTAGWRCTPSRSPCRCWPRTRRSSPGGTAQPPDRIAYDPLGVFADRRITDVVPIARPASPRCASAPRTSPPATPTWPGPGSPAGARPWPRPTTARTTRPSRPRSSRRRHRPVGAAAGRLAVVPARLLRAGRARLRATSIASVTLGFAGGTSITALRDGGRAGAAAGADSRTRSRRSRTARSANCSPRSCAGWTPTRSTPRRSARCATSPGWPSARRNRVHIWNDPAAAAS